MPNNWSSFRIDLGAVDPLASGIQTVTSAISTALTIQKTALDILATLALDLLNVEALLIKAALATIESILESFVVTDAKMHALVVPPRRQLPYKLSSDLAMPQEEDSWSIDDTISDEDKAAYQKMLKAVGEHDQGNPGFARTVIESLADEYDPHKPEYGETDATFTVVILAGAQSMVSLYELLAAIQGVFGAALKANPLIPAVVTRTPQNLKAKPISVPGTNRIGVRLQWNNAAGFQTLAEYDGTRVLIQEIAIIRSRGDETMVADNWGSLFGSEQPSPLTDDEGERQNVTVNGSNELIRIFRYDGIRDTYIDDEEDLEKGVDYYYTVAYRYALTVEADGHEAEPTLVSQNYHQISNVVKVRVAYDKVPSTHLSVQPNWVTHTSFLDMIPDLKFFMILVENYINSLKSRLTGSSSALASYVKYLQAEVDRYTAFAEDINSRVAKIAGLFQIPSTGIYMTTIESSTGGNEALVHTLVKRLMDESDTTAPPFFRNGVVGGLVLVAGAPNPAELTATKTLVSLLLGLESAVSTPFEDAVASIDVILNQLETAESEEEAVAYKTFDDAMVGVDAGDPDANIPFDP